MKKIFLFLLFAPSLLNTHAQKSGSHVVPLGVLGGIEESNLSAYMVAPAGTKDYICFDAGTINAGLQKAVSKKIFTIDAARVQKEYIKGYFISHAHLDHVSGLIITSPNDSNKTVYALEACMKMMQQYYFNGIAWANFGDEGIGFKLKKYHYQTLLPGEETAINNTTMMVKAFPLSHVNPFESTAFLVRSNDDYILYLGDTGPDSVEHSNKLSLLWQQIAPLINAKKLKGIFIEVSFPSDQPNDKLYGHLTPNWLMKEMEALGKMTDNNALQGLTVIVTHAKPPVYKIKKIQQEIKESNKLGLKIVFPQQGNGFTL
jgi:cAMP phosphodiesterase